MSAFYSSDFLVRAVDAVYLVETKAQEQLNNPNVQRKLKALLNFARVRPLAGWLA